MAFSNDFGTDEFNILPVYPKYTCHMLKPNKQ